jgi:hypothetical protein
MAFRSRAEQLLHSFTSAEQGGRRIAAGGGSIATSLVIVVGAVEFAVHGWDMRPCPQSLLDYREKP